MVVRGITLSGNKLDIFRLCTLGCKGSVHSENMHGKLNAHLLICTPLRLAHKNACHLIHPLTVCPLIIIIRSSIILDHDSTPLAPDGNSSTSSLMSAPNGNLYIKGGPKGVTPKYKACIATQGFIRIKGGFAQHFVTHQIPLHSTLRTHPKFTHIVTALDHLTTNTGTKCARHKTVRLIPTPNLWAKWTLAAPAMPSYALTLRCTPPGLRGCVGNPAAGIE